MSRTEFNIRYAKLIADRAAKDSDLVAVGYVEIPGTNTVESAFKVSLDVADLRGTLIAQTVAEHMTTARTTNEYEDAICKGIYDLRRIPNFNRACAAFVVELCALFAREGRTMNRELAIEPTPEQYQATLTEFEAKGIHLAKVHMIDPPAVQYTVAPFKGGRRHLCTWHEVEATLASLYGQTI